MGRLIWVYLMHDLDIVCNRGCCCRRVIICGDLLCYHFVSHDRKKNICCLSTEYVAINSMLDQINSYLDDLEERNDALNGKLHELMESNRQARLEFRAQLLGSQTQEEQRPANGDSSSGKEDLSKDNGDLQDKRDWVQQG